MKNNKLSFGQKLKQKFWRLLYPIFPTLEHTFLFLHQPERQKFHIGWLAQGKTLADLKLHLSKNWGFGNHFVAWEDNTQVLSWRKLDGFEKQYHLRVYSDGEIRGHYEFTPEAAPYKHFTEIDEQSKTDDFLKFLGEYVSQTKYSGHLEPDISVSGQESEITYEDNSKQSKARN